MTFNENVRIDPSKVRRRGRRNTGVVVGGGLGVLVLYLVAQLLGVDPAALTGAESFDEPINDPGLEHCLTGADANEDVECRMVGAADAIDTFWAAELPALGAAYRAPGFELFSGSVATACGNATSAVGPFYCPADETIYIDTTFFVELRDRFGATGGPLAEMYIVAHEWGHHVQHITGIMARADRTRTGSTSDAVRLELQADCFAGAWAGEASTTPDPDTGVPFLRPITQQEVAQALDAAAAVGDDRIQQAATGQVLPHTWTHGSSEQRQRWFGTGFESSARACDTFAATSL